MMIFIYVRGREMEKQIQKFLLSFKDLISRFLTSDKADKKTLARLDAILNNTVDGLVTINGHGVIESFNKGCEKIFGYQAKEVIGQNVKILMPEPYHSEHDSYLKNYHSTGHKKIIGIGREVQGRRKDGTVMSIDLAVSEVKVDGERLYSGILRDITERKKAEEEIMRSNEELERFAYIASHDLQEPLRMIANFTGLLEEEYKDRMDKQAVEYMEFIIDAAQRMQAMINDLLEYSRAGNQDVEFSDIDSNTQVKSVLDNLSNRINETGAKITYDHLPTIYVNPVRFARLMQNLIGNALKYRNADIPPEIHIGAENKGHEWLFSVTDNGIGMKEEYLQQIFIIFKRLHGKKDYPGTGIGLAVCKKIVENFGGQIWATSQPGKGSTFYFTIPKEDVTRKEAA